MEMIKNSPKDCYSTVQKTIMVVLERLQQVPILYPLLCNQLLGAARFCQPKYSNIVFTSNATGTPNGIQDSIND